MPVDTYLKKIINGKWIENEYGITVEGDVCIQERLKKIPIKFNIVSGNFICINNSLTTLKNTPVKVGGDFLIKSNNLTTLKNSPQIIYGNYNCSNNNIETLSISNTTIHGNFYCINNKLTNLKNGPKLAYGIYICYDNPLIHIDPISGAGIDDITLLQFSKKLKLNKNFIRMLIAYKIKIDNIDNIIEQIINTDINLLQYAPIKIKHKFSKKLITDIKNNVFYI